MAKDENGYIENTEEFISKFSDTELRLIIDSDRHGPRNKKWAREILTERRLTCLENAQAPALDQQRLVRHLDDFRRTAAEQRKTARMQQDRYGTGSSIYCEAIAVAATLEGVCACIESCLPNSSSQPRADKNKPSTE